MLTRFFGPEFAILLLVLLAAADKAPIGTIIQGLPSVEPFAAFACLTAFVRRKVSTWFVGCGARLGLGVIVGDLARRFHLCIELLELEGHRGCCSSG